MEHHDEDTHAKEEGGFLVFENGKITIRISETCCKSCGICIEFCPTKVLEPRDDGFPVVVAISKCNDCKLCELRCPDFAITVEKVAD
ncbi:MAG: 4Fe-4S binding protein [Candidatus Eisenbacteria bacterium]|nr:4Fe-4S binding protein [Candidatus Eisenbacteria bacterium]